MGLEGKNILVGVSGSISAYKACDLVQRLKDEGARVRVIMTPSAARLVHPNTFATLTGARVPVDGWSGLDAGAMDHIDLARWADVYLIAPCTAHTLAECAHGLTGSLLSLVYLVHGRRVFLAPAMNPVMLDAPATRRNLSLLEGNGDVILPTGEGILACGEEGHGKLLDPGHIIAYLKTRLALEKGLLPAAGIPEALSGKRVLVSLGHTREKWDDVRFLSNRSSGKTGLAIARAFALAGARVTVVAGNTEEPVTPGFQAVRAEGSEDIRREMLARQADADVIVMAAAVADFVPAQVHAGKKKGSKSLSSIELRAFPNVLREMGGRKLPGQILIGFALETDDPIRHARDKMRERNCDLMVVNNPVAADSGFGRGKVLAAILGGETENPHTQPAQTAQPTQLKEWDKDDLAAAVARLAAAKSLRSPGGNASSGGRNGPTGPDAGGSGTMGSTEPAGPIGPTGPANAGSVA